MSKRKAEEILESPPDKLSKLYTNSSSPFNLESFKELRYSGNIIILKIKDKRFFYDIEGLYNYTFTFFKFTDPYTRENFTIEQLDYILYKAYKKGLIQGVDTYKDKKLKTPDSMFIYNFSRKFFYIKRIHKCLRENDYTYQEIKKINKKYFCATNSVDDITGNYVDFPVVISDIYQYKHMNAYERNFMLSNTPILHGNRRDPVSFNCLRYYDADEIIKLKERGSCWKYYHVETIFIEITDNLNFRNFTIEQIDYICFSYNKYLNSLYTSEYIIDSPYNTYWRPFTMGNGGHHYKYNYILRINEFLSLLDERMPIYDENIQSFLSKLWGNFYLQRNLAEDVMYIPWCSSIE